MIFHAMFSGIIFSSLEVTASNENEKSFTNSLYSCLHLLSKIQKTLTVVMGTATLANNFLTIKFQSKSTSKKVALSDFGTRIMKAVQVTHRQGDIRYGMLRGIQCSCTSFMSIC